MKTTKHRTTETTVTVELTGKDIIALLRRTRRIARFPKNTRVLVDVPGGGDWSNTELDIGTDANVKVIYTQKRRR